MLRRGAGFRFCGVIRGLCQSTSGQVGLELFWADVPMEIVSAAADRPTIKIQKRFSIFGPSKIEISQRGVVSPRTTGFVAANVTFQACADFARFAPSSSSNVRIATRSGSVPLLRVRLFSVIYFLKSLVRKNEIRFGIT